MTWNVVAPDKTKSVKDNATILQENTTYTTTYMNKDHFWGIGETEDGHHNVVEMKKRTADPVLTLDGIIFTKEVSATNTRVEGFYKNSAGTYQFIPSYKSGSVLLNTTSSFHTLTDVPNNSYGYIYMYTATSYDDMGMGFFKAAGGVVQAYTIPVLIQNDNSSSWFFRFGNGSNVSGLNIRVKKPSLGTDTYNYKIVYWGL